MCLFVGVDGADVGGIPPRLDLLGSTPPDESVGPPFFKEGGLGRERRGRGISFAFRIRVDGLRESESIFYSISYV